MRLSENFPQFSLLAVYVKCEQFSSNTSRTTCPIQKVFSGLNLKRRSSNFYIKSLQRYSCPLKMYFNTKFVKFHFKNANIKQCVKLKTSIFHEICRNIFNFFLTIKKIITRPTSASIGAAVHKPKQTWSVESFSNFAILKR